jgi:hypothetical protein
MMRGRIKLRHDVGASLVFGFKGETEVKYKK